MRPGVVWLSLFVAVLTRLAFGQEIRLPLDAGSVRFAVIGDSGTGDSHQRDVANALVAVRERFPFAFVLEPTTPDPHR